MKPATTYRLDVASATDTALEVGEMATPDEIVSKEEDLVRETQSAIPFHERGCNRTCRTNPC